MTLDVTKMEALLKEFAEIDPMASVDDGDAYCVSCDSDDRYNHKDTCAWRQTREMLGLPLPQEPEPVEIEPSPYGVMIAQIWEPALMRYLTLRTPFSVAEGEWNKE